MVGQALLLTAGLWTSSAAEGQLFGPKKNCDCQNQNAASGPIQPVAKSPGWFQRGSSQRPILNRIFNKGNDAETAADYYRRMPNQTGEQPVVNKTTTPVIIDKTVAPLVVDSVKPISHQAAPKASPILPKFADKIGHENDFSWITGQLQQEKGVWVIYYASPETVDRFGGSLPIQAQEIQGVQNGDLVSIHGGVVTPTGGRPAYRATRIDLIERGR